MVHYIRYLRTPQVDDVNKRGIEVSAVVAVTTDLGDTFFARNISLLARVVDVTKSGEILASNEVAWHDSSRAVKIRIILPLKLMNRLVTVHVTTKDSLNAVSQSAVPSILDVWSASLSLRSEGRAKRVVERRLQLPGKCLVRQWEETGDSIARHIWDASLGCLILLEKYLTSHATNDLPSIRNLMVQDKSRHLRVLEVGAGCGLVGIALSQLRKCEVLLTDLEDAQDILQTNIDCATPVAGSSLARQVLGWGLGTATLANPKFDLVLVSDCIYNPDSSVQLVQTLREITRRNPDVVIFVAFKRRHDADDVFFDHMTANGFLITEQATIELPNIASDYDAYEPRIDAFTFVGKK